MAEEKQRADVMLTMRGLVPSRERARALIAAGLVTVNGIPVRKAAQSIDAQDELKVIGETHPYVSRGGLKLEKALASFGVNPAGAVCMDIGASTGGFTDVLLRAGARRVYAIDVGTGQLDARISADPRVTNLEHVNARAMGAELFDEMPALAVMDVSFISIKLILPAAFAILGDEGRMISLIKPQFEAGRHHIGKRGIVSSPQVHAQVLREIMDFVPTLGWRVQGLDYSPISGGDGNIEFLADLVPRRRCVRGVSREETDALVRRAHAAISVNSV